MDISQCNTQGLIQDLLNKGFHKINQKPQNGKSIAINQPVWAGVIRDCSFLRFIPQIAVFPTHIDDLKQVIASANKFSIPISFAGGKTGLSGGFANPFLLVDLEHLKTLDNPIQIDNLNHQVWVDQSVIVAELIRKISFETNNQYIFPTQPSSSYKLPVRIGGLIATNASGVTSGKLGPIADWIEKVSIMTPKGEICTITITDELFCKIIGGMGVYGIILNAQIRLAQVESNYHYRIVFGTDLIGCFNGLEKIQKQRIFPLINEFILSSDAIPGSFAKIFQEQSFEGKIRWAILVKDQISILHEFTQILLNQTNTYFQDLDAKSFQDFMEERSALAIQSYGHSSNDDYIRFPGFEDFLISPKFGMRILEEITEIFNKFDFPAPMVGYGHLNFRKGQGILLHLRVPVSVLDLSQNSTLIFEQLAKLLAFLNITLVSRYGIQPKAEHSPGILTPWVNRKNIKGYFQDVRNNHAFFHPAYYIFFTQLIKSINNHELNDPVLKNTEFINLDFKNPDFLAFIPKYLNSLSENDSVLLIEKIFLIYLKGKL